MRSENESVEKVRQHFVTKFNPKGRSILVRSPGRINLIGEHTDYNEGFVLPSAIDRAIYLEIAMRGDTRANIYAIDLDRAYSFDLDKPLQAAGGWSDYLTGVVDQLLRLGYRLDGFDCAFSGDIPIGAGMSSSAAIEAGLAFALNELNSLSIGRRELALIAQRAENEFVGVNCGIMDQFANLLSAGESVLYLDCRSLNYEHVPFHGKDMKFILCDTVIKHELARSDYNQRRMQCEGGVQLIRRSHPEVRSLRDVDLDLLQQEQRGMDPVIYHRCEYVVEENLRVETACESIRQGDYERFGHLLYDSHRGLRDKYQVSCVELDVLVEAASGSSGVLGSRMMGGGFGGCTLNLVETDFVEDFSERVRRVYSGKTGTTPKIYECGLTAGTNILDDTGD